MHRKLSLLAVVVGLIAGNLTGAYAQNSVEIKFTVAKIAEISVPITGPTIAFGTGEIPGTKVDASTYNLSTNLPSWKIMAYMYEIIPAADMTLSLGTPVPVTGGSVTSQGNVEITSGVTNKRTLMIGTNGAMADPKALNYSVTSSMEANTAVSPFDYDIILSIEEGN